MRRFDAAAGCMEYVEDSSLTSVGDLILPKIVSSGRRLMSDECWFDASDDCMKRVD